MKIACLLHWHGIDPNATKDLTPE